MAKGPVVQLYFVRRWWVTPYLHTLAFVSALTGMEPDWDKVTGFIVRHCIKLEPAKS